MSESKPNLHSTCILFEHEEDCLRFGDLAFFIKVTAELSMSHLSMCGIGQLLYLKTIIIVIHLLDIFKFPIYLFNKTNTKKHSNTSMRQL